MIVISSIKSERGVSGACRLDLSTRPTRRVNPRGSRGRPQAERLIADGRGEYRSRKARQRCGYCGGAGAWQLRPPATRPGLGAVAYIAPPAP